MITISVLMSVYKEPIEWVKEAINSILIQTFKDFEFLICLDNPDYEEMKDYLCQLTHIDQRVKIIFNKENIGLTKSLNILLKEAKGKYIARMDADDISYPNRFQTQLDFMESNPEISLVGSSIKRFGNTEKIVIYDNDPKSIYDNFTYHNPYLSPVAHPTAFIRKEVLDLNNLKYNESYRTAQDYALWNEILKVGKISNIKEVLLDYRESNQQITKLSKNNQHNVVLSVIYDHVKYFIETKLSIDLTKQPLNLEQLIKITKEQKDIVIKRKLQQVIYCICYLDTSISYFILVKIFINSDNRDQLDSEAVKRIFKKKIKSSLR